jgi:hypothetical protein
MGWNEGHIREMLLQSRREKIFYRRVMRTMD